jgi:hypothetical protein
VAGCVVAPVLGGAVVVDCARPESPPSLHATASNATAVSMITRRRPHRRSGLWSQRTIRVRWGDRIGDNA